MGPVIDQPIFSHLSAELDRVVDGEVTLAEFRDKFMLEYFTDDHESLPSWNRVFHILAEPGTNAEILEELSEERDSHRVRPGRSASSGTRIVGSRLEVVRTSISLR